MYSMVESLCNTPKTNIILYANYTGITRGGGAFKAEKHEFPDSKNPIYAQDEK